MSERQLVVFSIDDKLYGIEIAHVSSIEKPSEMHSIPNTPEFIEGLMNLRGKVYTVFNLRERFGISDKAFDEETKIIMVNKGSSTIGFIIDKVNEIINVNEKDISNLPDVLDNLKNKFVNSVVTIGEKTICLLDLDKTFTISDEDNEAFIKSHTKSK